MTLKDLVAERYRAFISIEEVILEISEKYQCSEDEARHVLAEALAKAPVAPTIYERQKLGPSEVNSLSSDFIFKSLSNPDRNANQELDSGIPF
jgi:hypothetical protein